MSTEENHEERRCKQTLKALGIIQSNRAITDKQKSVSIEILERVGESHRQRLYFPEETADAVIALVTNSKEPEGSKRTRQIYRRLRDEVQPWGLVEQVSLEASNLKDFADVCIKLAFDPVHIEALVERYRYVMEHVVLGGKTPPYTIAAVITHYAKQITGTAIGVTQVDEMCEMLKIKRKTLKRYADTLSNFTSSTREKPSSPKKKKHKYCLETSEPL